MIIEQTIELPAVADNSFFEDTRSYITNQGLEIGKEAEIALGSYADLNWSSTPGLSDEDVISWGTKTLPGAGPFYFANHEDGNPTIGHLDTTDRSIDP